jgi:SAM-dependent methyltransferase
MPRLLAALARSRVGRPLAPAWFDEARFIVQAVVIDRVMGGRALSGRVLNAGCGEGLYAPLIERFPRVTLIVNVDQARPSIAATRKDRRHRDLRATLARLPFASAAFDAIVCTEVLEHIPEDDDAVAELSRVLRPSGLLLASVPMPPAPFDPAHVREGYTRDAFAALLARHGIDVVASDVCLHAAMRALYRMWRAQLRAAGRNVFPRFLLRSTAQLDRRIRVGRPWDLVVVGVRR